jgi:nucleoid-associated protein YgaU
MPRPFLFGLAGALLLAAALVLWFVVAPPDRGAPVPGDSPSAGAAPPARAVADAAKQLTEPARPAANPPSFDVVRVNPQGDAVIAGRAEPGAAVEVRDGARVIGRVTADERGEWVLLPSEPLPGGKRALSLQATRDGAPPVTSDKVVEFDLPARGAARADAGAPGDGAAAAGADAARTAAAGARAPETGQAVVQPGNSLWELARRRYGNGLEYGTIYQANRGQIRDPDLIYPGQVFVIPPSR